MIKGDQINLFLHLIERKTAKTNNLKYYYTARRCKHGHLSQRWTLSGKCISCHYEENPLTPIKSSSQRNEERKLRAKRWYEKNKALTIARAKKWKIINKKAVRESDRKWTLKPRSKAIRFMRDSIRRLLISKKGRTEDILGYSRDQLVLHLEKQFLKGMSWENKGEWHIDHIIPIAEHLKNGVTDPAVINCLTNLRPIWADANLRKGSSVESLL